MMEKRSQVIGALIALGLFANAAVGLAGLLRGSPAYADDPPKPAPVYLTDANGVSMLQSGNAQLSLPVRLTDRHGRELQLLDPNRGIPVELMGPEGKPLETVQKLAIPTSKRTLAVSPAPQ